MKQKKMIQEKRKQNNRFFNKIKKNDINLRCIVNYYYNQQW